MIGEILLAATLTSSAPPKLVEGKLGRLPQCAAAEPFDTSGWQRTPYLPFDVLLPPGFQEDKAAQQSVHGSQSWTDGMRQVRITHGHWSPASFEDGTNCRTKIGKVHVFVRERVYDDGALSVVVWYLLENGRMEPLVNAWSPRKDDRELLHAIARSLSLH